MTKTIKIFILGLSVSLMWACTPPKTQTDRNQRPQRQERGAPTFAQLLEKMDANEDGKLSKNEVKGPLKRDFSKVDSDEDGFITESELKNAPKPEGRPGPRQPNR